MKKVILILFFILGFSQSFADNQIVAVVDKDVITKSDLDDRLKTTLETNPGAAKLSEAELVSNVLNAMVNEKVFLQEAKKLGIEPSEKEIEGVIRHIEQTKGMSKGELMKDIEKKGLSKSIFLDQIKTNITWERMLSEVIAGSIEVSNEELLRFISSSQPKKVYVDARVIGVSAEEKNSYKTIASFRSRVKDCGSIAGIKNKSVSIENVDTTLSNIENVKTRKLLSEMHKGQISEIYEDGDQNKFVVVCSKKYDMNTTEMSSFDNMLRENKISVQADHYMQNLKKKKFIEIYDF